MSSSGTRSRRSRSCSSRCRGATCPPPPTPPTPTYPPTHTATCLPPARHLPATCPPPACHLPATCDHQVLQSGATCDRDVSMHSQVLQSGAASGDAEADEVDARPGFYSVPMVKYCVRSVLHIVMMTLYVAVLLNTHRGDHIYELGKVSARGTVTAKHAITTARKTACIQKIHELGRVPDVNAM